MGRDWGKLAIIDLKNCNFKIKSPEKIKKFVFELCESIGMERHGPLHIDRFGEGDLEGYSCMQFLKTSSITVHFDELKSRAFIDIFSCKDFDENGALNFSKKFFEAEGEVESRIRK